MKRVVFATVSFFIAGSLVAQEPADALRYSWTVPSGTARQQAIGGAMGSLGGDLSATFTNPAGLAFYRTGDLVLSPMYQFGKNKASYIGRTEMDQNNSKLVLGTSGVVFGSGSAGRNVRNASFSLAYNRTANFNGNILYRGANNKSSFSQKFVEELNNYGRTDSTVTFAFPYGSSLAFNTYWIDPVYNSSGSVDSFATVAPIATGLLQQQMIQTRGGINEFALGGAVNLNDKVYIGATIGVPVLHYERIASFTEADATTNPNNRFNFATFDENLVTKGVGLNLRAGLIVKPQENLRLGLAFQTPTIYNLTDSYYSSVSNDTADSQSNPVVLTDYSEDYTYDVPAEIRYSLVTPYKVTASLSYVFSENADVTKQKGFITADVDYVNYKSSSFQTSANSTYDEADNQYYKDLNTAIDNAYKSAVNVRVGGELKFTTFMVRAGVAYYGNPYQDINGESGNKLNLSGGLGYRNKGFFADLTYVQAINKDVHFAYRLENSPYYGATIRSALSNVLLTVGLKF